MTDISCGIARMRRPVSGKERWRLRRGGGRIRSGAGQNFGRASDAVACIFGNNRTTGCRWCNQCKSRRDTAGLAINHHIMIFMMLVRCGAVFGNTDRNNTAIGHCFITDENRFSGGAAFGGHLQQGGADIHRSMGKRQQNKRQYAQDAY